jgi:hypothetical protein
LCVCEICFDKLQWIFNKCTKIGSLHVFFIDMCTTYNSGGV